LKPSPPNFNATVIFCHFMSSNLYVFVRCIVNFLPSQSDSQIHANLNSWNEKTITDEQNWKTEKQVYKRTDRKEEGRNQVTLEKWPKSRQVKRSKIKNFENLSKGSTSSKIRKIFKRPTLEIQIVVAFFALTHCEYHELKPSSTGPELSKYLIIFFCVLGWAAIMKPFFSYRFYLVVVFSLIQGVETKKPKKTHTKIQKI
jgi:hypothetical protein